MSNGYWIRIKDEFHILKYDLISKHVSKIWAKRIFCFKEIQMSKTFVFETSYQKVFVLALVFSEVIQW